jgi:hypothetical protein
LAQTIHLKVMAPTAGPALVFEPAVVDFEVLLVNNEAVKELTLVNTSDSDISYELLFVKYPPPGVQEPLRILLLENNGKNHALFVKDPRGVLPARSKTITSVRT